MRALARSPLYRFHGRHDPRSTPRVPVLNTASPPKESDGVATLRLYGPIDSWGDFWGVSALEFLDALDQVSTNATDIRLHINSPGGEVFEGISILNALRQHPARVTAIVDGIAASAASFIATGADEVVMAPNTELMIHDAWGICIGPAADMHQVGDELDRISDNIASIYAAKADGDLADWRSAMLAETWYSADEAVAAGLADRVLGDAGADSEDGVTADDSAEARARFDTQALFKHSSRAAAPPPPTFGGATSHRPPGQLAPAAALSADDWARRHRHNARRAGVTNT